MVVAGGYVEQVLHCQPQPKNVSCLAGKGLRMPSEGLGQTARGSSYTAFSCIGARQGGAEGADS